MRSLSECRVMIVDDTETNVDQLVDTLGGDYLISVAMDGPGALELAEEVVPDLLLLDIMMPGMTGYEVIERLKANSATRDIPVVFCTAMSDDEDEMKGLELGAIDYIRKPFCPAIVKARVRNHLELKLAKKKLEEQNSILKENIRLREDVERITQHDLKVPLNAFINIPQLLQMEGGLSDGHLELLRMLEESAYRMLEMINRSLDLYKMETGSYRLVPGPVNLLKVLKQIQGEMRSMIRVRKLSLDVRLNGKQAEPDDELLIAGEELLCYSMLANLVKNALEASPDGETVAIELGSSGCPTVAIHNMGAVPDELRGRFFEKYATGGKKGGTGLGTYSAALIARTLGGRIGFESSEESGTTVFIEFRHPGSSGSVPPVP